MQTTPKILIVDDELMVHIVLGQLIKSYGFEALKASSGQEAEQLIDQLVPDLILLDIHIPDTDSMALLQSFIQNPKLKNTRIIIITGGNNLDIISTYVDAGADDYVLKPFHAALLKTRLIHALERVEMNQQADNVKIILSEATVKLQKAVNDSAKFSEQLSHDLNNVLLGVGMSSQLLSSKILKHNA